MNEEATRVPPALPVAKSKGDDKRRLLDSPRDLKSVEKKVPHYLRASTGSCHDFCKHGKPEGYVSETKGSRPWRRPVSSSGRDSLGAKESGVSSVSKKAVVVKPKPSGDPKSQSFGEETVDQEILSTSENIDMHTEQASSNIKTVRDEAKTSHGLETTLRRDESLNQEIPMAPEKVSMTVENASSDTKDSRVSKKSSILSKVMPSSRPPSPIPLGSSHQKSTVGRKSVDGSNTLSKAKPPSRSPSPIPLGSSVRRSTDGRKSVDGSSTLSKAKPSSKPPSPPISLGSCVRRSIDGRNSVEGSITLSKAMPTSRSPSPIPSGSSIWRSMDGRKSVEGRTRLDGTKAFEGRKSVDERKSVKDKKTIDGKKGIVESASAIPETTHRCDGNVRNSRSNSEGSLSADEKKGSEGSNSLNSESNKKDDTSGDGKIDGKSDLSKKHVAAPKPRMLIIKPQPSLIPTISRPPSSRPSASGEAITNAKMVRVVRVVSSLRKPTKIIKVVAKDPNDQGLHEDDTAPADAIKTAPENKSLASIKSKVASSKSLIPSAPAVPTVRSRMSNVQSRLKILPVTSEQKSTVKDTSSSVLRKGKGADLKSENQNTLKATKATSVRETAQLNRRSVKIRVSPGVNAVEKNNSDSVLLRRPSVRRKKNAQVLFNKVIEETASRLVRTSKNKVLALVGAFETVISIQKKSSTTAKAKRLNSTRKPSH